MILGIDVFWHSFLFRRPPRSRAIEASERAQARLEDSTRRLKRAVRRVLKLERGVAKSMTREVARIERAKAIAETIAEDVKDALQAIERSEQSMEILRTEHEADSAAIETLTARIKEYQAMCEANIALANHRRGQMAPSTEM